MLANLRGNGTEEVEGGEGRGCEGGEGGVWRRKPKAKCLEEEEEKEEKETKEEKEMKFLRTGGRANKR